MDATAIQGEDEKSLEGNEQQLCSWEGRHSWPLAPPQEAPLCQNEDTRADLLVCAATHIITSSGSFPFHATTLKSAPQTCPQLRQRWAAMTCHYANQEGFEKEKGHNYGQLVTPGRPASAGSVLGAGSGGGDTVSRGERT